ncbi:carbohydrate ABC transporter permease [Spirilliplanes yamanashiensis]|uniref:Sugar ABC transporter permease n=1 Tax=Spirilliplanes yamanashiensis TaxID=42233 RepID=A0A8J3Y784_9ACTN|nr:sugar ABC transporter permease [Spirilliplanes yamanashiensis]MDP9817166.1 N,N'-diacetylchitobiose transport system permease protein [Spirilliplanes yamanashiensis]GIJ03181.1 sugar ABC transporter permease [Spirilliplanes yamanashiensis]
MPQRGAVKPKRRKNDSARTPLLLAAPALLILAALLGYPMFRMMQLSFQDMRLRQLLTGVTPPWVGLDNYTNVLTDPFFWDVVRRTATFTVVSVVLSVVFGLAVALLMRRVARPVRLAMVVAMMFVWAVPQLVQAQIFKWMVDTDFGVFNYLLAQIGLDYQGHSWFADPTQGWIVITTLVIWAGIPFLAITLNAGLTQVPKELLEAAVVDGASPWQALRRITLPILKPLITIVTTLSVIWNFGLFTQVWVLRDSKVEPEYQTLGTYSFIQAFGQSKYSLGSAIAVITVLLMLGVTVFYIRQMFKIGEVD